MNDMDLIIVNTIERTWKEIDSVSGGWTLYARPDDDEPMTDKRFAIIRKSGETARIGDLKEYKLLRYCELVRILIDNGREQDFTHNKNRCSLDGMQITAAAYARLRIMAYMEGLEPEELLDQIIKDLPIKESEDSE